MFGGGTVMVNVVLVVVVPSLTVTVIVAVPLLPDAGVTTSDRDEPVPLKTMFAFGTSVVFDEDAVIVRLAGTVSLSLMVKLSAALAELRVMVRFENVVIVGGVFVVSE
jgi:hypothetical protein